MNNFMKAGLCLAILAMAGTAQAAERARSGSYENRGGMGSFQQKVDRGASGMQRNTKWQNQNGEGSSSYQRQWNRDTQSGEASRETTNARGQTSGMNKTFQKNDDGSYGAQGNYTGYRGNTYETNKTVVKNADGTYSSTNTVNNQNGQSYTSNSTTVKTDDGWQRQGSYATGDGQAGTYSDTMIRGENGVTTQSTVTGVNGNEYNRTSEYSHEGGDYSKTVTQTGPQGKSRSWTNSMHLND